MGQLVQVRAGGTDIQVDIPSLGLIAQAAVSLVPLTPDHVGKPAALAFENAQAHRPVVLGLMLQTAAPAAAQITASADESPASNPVRITHNGKRVVIEAETELELRCGDAVIVLSQDGQIQIRGTYVTSHASASQRIRGGSVQIN